MVSGSGGCRHWGASVVSGGDGWLQLMAPVGGSGGLQGEKTSTKFFLFQMSYKAKKQHVFFLFFFQHLGWWVGGSEASVEFSTLCLTLPY